MNSRYPLSLTLFTSVFLLACSTPLSPNKINSDINLPNNWQGKQQLLPVENDWLTQFEPIAMDELITDSSVINNSSSDNLSLNSLVQQALKQNRQLKSASYSVEMKKQNLISSGSQLWPALDLSFRSSRNKNNEPVSYGNSSSLNLNFSYELDIWGKLSAKERADNLTLLSEQANFEQSKQKLVVDVASTWFEIIAAEQLIKLYQNRVLNSQQNLAVIESNYQEGLTDALDVYLARNELNNEFSRVSDQKVSKVKLVRQLQSLIGEYPSGKLNIQQNLPLITNEIPQGLPSSLVSRKPSLKASWYQLLAQDANLAYAHKQRFPSLSLSASLGDSAENVGDLLSGSSLAWSLLSNITSPIFNAGRLKANEEQARFALKQSEQQYLDSLYQAFSEVENSLTLEKSLKENYQTMLAAQENAKVAATLAFEQYQSGLVTYITVLDSQSRSFEAQSALIKTKLSLIANRIQLHLSLGGDFSVPSQSSTIINSKAD